MSEFASVVRGVGGYLPEKVLTNEDLSKMVDTTDEWITARTGIRKLVLFNSHGGQVSVSSPPGQGAHFSVTLPLG